MQAMTAFEKLADSSPSEPFSVFISYARTDSRTADELAAMLESHAIDVRIDRRALPLGRRNGSWSWQRRSARPMRCCGWSLPHRSLRDGAPGGAGRGHSAEQAARAGQNRPGRRRDDSRHLGRLHFLPAEGTFSLDDHLFSLLAALSAHRPWVKAHTLVSPRAHVHGLMPGGPRTSSCWAAGNCRTPRPGSHPRHRPRRAFAPAAANRAAADVSHGEPRGGRSGPARADDARAGVPDRHRLPVFRPGAAGDRGACFDRALRLALAGICLSRPDTRKGAVRGCGGRCQRVPVDHGSAARSGAQRGRADAGREPGGGGRAGRRSRHLGRGIGANHREAPGPGLRRGRQRRHRRRGGAFVVGRVLEYADVVDARTGRCCARSVRTRAGLRSSGWWRHSVRLHDRQAVPEASPTASSTSRCTCGTSRPVSGCTPIDDFSGPVQEVTLTNPSREMFVTGGYGAAGCGSLLPESRFGRSAPTSCPFLPTERAI